MKYLLCVMCIIAIVDLVQYRVPNWCIILGISIGIVEKIVHGGMICSMEAVLHMMLILLLFWPFYVVKGIGAGDIKLFMMMSLYFDSRQMLLVLLGTFLIAAILSVFKMIRYPEGRQRVIYLGRWIKKTCLTGCMDSVEFPIQKSRTTIRLSMPALISVCSWIIAAGKGWISI